MSEQALQTIQKINEHMHAMMKTDPLEITSFGSTIDTIFSRLDNANVVLYMLHSLFGDMDRLVKLTTLWLRRHRGNDQLGTATTLSMQAYAPPEKDKAQAAINFFVFATMALTSFASGALVTTQGWTWLNWGSLPPVVITACGLLFLRLRFKKI